MTASDGTSSEPPSAQPPGSHDKVVVHGELGIRAAASAVRKALFFVELMRSRPAQLSSVDAFPRLANACRAFHFDEDDEHCRGQIARILATVPVKCVEPRLQTEWMSLRAKVPTTPQRDKPLDVESFDADLTAFLRAAVRPPRERRWDDASELVKRNVATLIGASALVIALLFVEQLNALFFDQWGCVLWALIILLPVPVIAWFSYRLRKSRIPLGRLRAAWNRTSLFWRASARHPLGYDTFSAGSGIGRQLALGATLKAAFSLVWLSLCAIILSFVGSRIMQTVGWTVCLLLAMATALAALDFWDFIHPAPVRRRFLLCACVMAVIYALTDFSIYTIVGTALTWLVASVHAIWKRGQGWKSLGAAVGLVALIGIGGMLFEEVTDRTESWKSSDAVIVRIPSPAPHTKAAYPEGLPAEVSRWWPHPGPARALRAPPVVVMAASGGGSRAAVLTALTLEKLASTPIPSAGANRPAIAAPAESFADHLHAISSVSGGSLATAAFLARRLRGESPEGLSRDVADDFLQPVLLGALDPFTSRGQALEDYWVDKLHLGDRLSSVAARWKEGIREKLPPLPVPLFNSATLDAHAVVLTPLDWAGYKNKLEASAADGQSLYERGDGQAEPPTWVYYRSAIYSLQDLLPGYDPTLASAVRASANFPFGFPVVQLATSRPLCFSPVLLDAREGPKERVRLTDGGVVSNSGLWTLSRLLATHAEELRARGVILVIVDGSRMPEYKGRTRTRDLVSAILDQSLIAANLHSTMLEYLRERLERRLAVAVVALDPKEAYNVYTSWALDESSRKQIEQVTAPTLEALSERVTTAWKALESGAELAELPHRLPLD